MVEDEESHDEVESTAGSVRIEGLNVSAQGAATLLGDPALLSGLRQLLESALGEVEGNDRAAVLEQRERKPAEARADFQEPVVALDASART